LGLGPHLTAIFPKRDPAREARMSWIPILAGLSLKEAKVIRSLDSKLGTAPAANGLPPRRMPTHPERVVSYGANLTLSVGAGELVSTGEGTEGGAGFPSSPHSLCPSNS
jgi:hypothetical protein